MMGASDAAGPPARVAVTAAGGGPDLPALPRRPPARKALLFCAGGEWFAVGLERVREVCARAAVTRVPRAPAPVLGVMNLRGRPVTLVDLPLCLGLPPGGADHPHAVLLDLGDPDLDVGILADRVDQVVELDPEAPGHGAPGGGPDVVGPGPGPNLVEAGGRVVTLLDPVRVMAGALPGAAGEGPGGAA